MAAPVFDAASSSSGSEVYGTTTTFAHTVTASGSGRIALVGTTCKYTAGRYVSGITYGGEALTKKIRLSPWYAGTHYLELWYLVNPPTGANNVIVTYTGNVYDACAALSYTGVDPDMPLGTLTSAIGSGYTLTAPSVASASDEVVIDVATTWNAVASTFNPGALQTLRKKKYETNSALWIGMSEEPGDTSVDMTWSHNQSRAWGILAVSLKPEQLGPARLIKYWASTLDPKRRIFDNTGRVIPASLVEYDNWLRNEGPYFMTPNKHTSLIEADSIGYLEAIKFNESGRTQFITETETLLESLFRRLGARGA